MQLSKNILSVGPSTQITTFDCKMSLGLAPMSSSVFRTCELESTGRVAHVLQNVGDTNLFVVVSGQIRFSAFKEAKECLANRMA